MKSKLKRKLRLQGLILGTILGLVSFSSNANSTVLPFKGHSVKKLDVAGNEMVLIQLFLNKDNQLVIAEDDYLGISQKDRLVSFYMDYQNAHPAIKSSFKTKSYIRDKAKLKEILESSFAIKTTVKGDDQIISVKTRP